MAPIAETLTTVLAWGTLLAQIAIIALIVLLIREHKTHQTHPSLVFLRLHALKLGFLLALGSSAVTLVYSELFGFLPCGLCWLERVFLYPQVVLLGMSLWKSDRNVADYVIGLSIPGFIIALYHHFIQMGGTDFLPCPSTPGAADCAQRIIFEFGYITFPLMAATVFALLIVAALTLKRS